MKRVGEQGGMLILELSFGEWAVLSTLIRNQQGQDRKPGKLSHSGAGQSPEEAQRCLEEAVRADWLADEQTARKLLGDSSRCVLVDKVATLRITPAEVDALLRVVNGKRLSAWESLGRPALEDIKAPKDRASLEALRLLNAADFFVASLLSIYK